MTLSRHQTLSGQVLDLHLPPAEDAFLAVLRGRVADPTTSLNAIVYRAYSDQNPMLTSAPVPGREGVTSELRARPDHTALLDILQRKTLAQLGGELEGSAGHNLPGSEAAGLLGVSPVSACGAAAAGRPPGLEEHGRIEATRSGSNAGSVSKRLPEPSAPAPRPTGEPLSIVHRGAQGYSLAFRTDGNVVAGKGAEPTTVTGWSEVWVKTVDKGVSPGGKVRVVRLVPGAADARHGVGPLSVTGRFSLDQSLWGRSAMDCWKSQER